MKLLSGFPYSFCYDDEHTTVVTPYNVYNVYNVVTR